MGARTRTYDWIPALVPIGSSRTGVCKWGCCGFGWLCDDKTAFSMDTPWSEPAPIFHRLVELYPLLTFSCHFVEPGNDIDFVKTYTA